MDLRKDSKYALLVPTSMGLRLCPPDGQPVGSGDMLMLQATSAETNVASVCSYLGQPVKVLTAFVQGSPMADYIKRDLRKRGMDFEGKEVPQGGPWGYRHQINIADSGFGNRGPRVWNDRAGEVGCTMTAGDFELDRIFGQDGVQIVHMSGLVAALSPQTASLCLEIARKAKKAGTRISFDLNYRASFWKNREEELSEVFAEIASLSDILVGNEEDFQLSLGLEGPESGGKGINDKIDSFKCMIEKVRQRYPQVIVCATTLREVITANSHLWGAVLSEGAETEVILPRQISVLDRIGGGDGFVGGLLYGIIKHWDIKKQAQFAWASGALAASMLTDYAQIADEQQVFAIWEGNARVVR